MHLALECSTVFNSEHLTVRLLLGAGQIVYSEFKDLSLMKTVACLKPVEPCYCVEILLTVYYKWQLFK